MKEHLQIYSGSNSTDVFAQMSTPVVYVIPSLSTGGAELQTINQVNFLFSKGLNVKLLVLSNHTRNISRLKLPENHVGINHNNSFETLGKRYLRNMFGIVRFLINQIPGDKPVHVILVLEESHIAGRMFKLFRPKAFIHCYYRDVHYTPNRSFGVNVFDWINNRLARLMDDSSFFISQAVKNDIKKKYFTTNPLTIPNSLPNLKIDESKGKEFIEQRNLMSPYLVLFPGRLHVKKGHLLFLHEFNLFIKKERLDQGDIRLVLVGDGPERGVIEDIIQETNLEDFVFLAGELPHELLLSLYKCSNLVVIPSLREGFGNVAIEGLMQEALMLVSKADGLAEIIREGENGFTFDVHHEGECADRLSFLYRNRDKILIKTDQLSADFHSRYSLQSHMTKIIQHLQETEKVRYGGK